MMSIGSLPFRMFLLYCYRQLHVNTKILRSIPPFRSSKPQVRSRGAGNLSRNLGSDLRVVLRQVGVIVQRCRCHVFTQFEHRNPSTLRQVGQLLWNGLS